MQKRSHLTEIHFHEKSISLSLIVKMEDSSKRMAHLPIIKDSQANFGEHALQPFSKKVNFREMCKRLHWLQDNRYSNLPAGWSTAQGSRVHFDRPTRCSGWTDRRSRRRTGWGWIASFLPQLSGIGTWAEWEGRCPAGICRTGSSRRCRACHLVWNGNARQMRPGHQKNS